MKVIDKIKIFCKKYIFSSDWRCLSCGKEIFKNEKFCEECFKKLPFNDGPICDHCGRKVVSFTNYCSTCREKLLSLDKGRSVFSYEKPISSMIKRLKYGNQRFLAEYFIEQLSFIYLKNCFNANLITFVPMTKKAMRRRGYNQSYILAKGLSERLNVELFESVEKIKETKRQATLTKKERQKNLVGAFKITDKKSVKDKTIVIVDDVTTTGATSEVLAERLKSAGARNVYLITVASLPPKDKY